MIHQILKDKPTKLFLGITAFFVANALIAECIGGKIFSLESVFGFKPSRDLLKSYAKDLTTTKSRQ